MCKYTAQKISNDVNVSFQARLLGLNLKDIGYRP